MQLPWIKPKCYLHYFDTVMFFNWGIIRSPRLTVVQKDYVIYVYKHIIGGSIMCTLIKLLFGCTHMLMYVTFTWNCYIHWAKSYKELERKFDISHSMYNISHYNSYWTIIGYLTMSDQNIIVLSHSLLELWTSKQSRGHVPKITSLTISIICFKIDQIFGPVFYLHCLG